MDNLKKYLQNHLDELDNDVPGDAVWQKIQQTATPVLPKKGVVKMMWRYAAAACVLACIAAVFFLVNKKQTNPSVATINPVKEVPKQTDVAIRNQPQLIDTLQDKITPQTIEPTAPEKQAPANVYAKKEAPKKMPVVERKQKTIDPAQLIVKDVERNYATLVNMQLERLRVTPVYAESPNYFSTFKQQLKQIEADEIAIKKDIRMHGLNDELLQQLININQQKLTVLKDLQAEISKLNNKVKQPENQQDSSRTFYLTM